MRLTEEQWADIQKGSDVPPRVSNPAGDTAFVLLKAEAYERFKALFEEDPNTKQERLYQLEQFGKRAGWDDPTMDVYDDLDPREPYPALDEVMKEDWSDRKMADYDDYEPHKK